MSILHSLSANCKNCYRCIRGCPVKAIGFKDNQASIVEEDCILCGQCIVECPQHAMVVESEVESVQQWLTAKKRVVVSLAPSFVGYFESPGEFLRQLLDMGFADVRETAEAAAVVADYYYEQYAQTKQLITTACPVVVDLIEKHYPELVGFLAAVDSPMIAHGKMIKQFDLDAYVVFIGPCYAKKKEAENGTRVIDAVLTFDEIATMIDMHHGDGSRSPEMHESVQAQLLETLGVSRSFPVEGGVIETTFHDKAKPASYRALSGIALCETVLSRIKERDTPFFLELNACSGGCIQGPVSGTQLDLLEKQDRVYQFLSQSITADPLPPISATALSKTFHDRCRIIPTHTDREIRDVLSRIGKNSADDELNCGACGYRTCRDKAVAVLEGRAELTMCMPYMQARAESFSNMVFEHTPNGILAVGDDLIVKEANLAVCSFFGVNRRSILELPTTFLFSSEELPLSKMNRLIDKVFFARLQKTAMVNVSYVFQEKMYLIVLTDLTEREHEQEKLQQLKEDTIQMAQNVIDNQMRFSQEIASLLGETTAETKVTLTRLKKLVLGEL